MNHKILERFFGKEEPLPKNPSKILIFKVGAIGDVLMTTPLVKTIRKVFPNSEIVYYTGNWSKSVIQNNPNISRIESFDESAVFKKNIFGLLSLRKIIIKEKFDLTLVLDRAWLEFLFIASCKIPFRIGLDRNREGFSLTNKIPDKLGRHHIDSYLELASFWKHKSVNRDMEIFPTTEEIKNSKEKLVKIGKHSPLIAIAPGGAKNPGQDMAARRWPIQKYAELITNLKRNYPKSAIILLGGPSDKDAGEYLTNPKNKQVFNLIGETKIAETYEIMKQCNVVITHDSGPMHIASASGTKVISLFGPTDPWEKYPIHSNDLVIWEKQACAPCLDSKGYEKCQNYKCMESITVEKVMQKIKKVLK